VVFFVNIYFILSNNAVWWRKTQSVRLIFATMILRNNNLLMTYKKSLSLNKKEVGPFRHKLLI